MNCERFVADGIFNVHAKIRHGQVYRKPIETGRVRTLLPNRFRSGARRRGGFIFFLSPRTIVRMRAARGLPGPFNEKAAPSSAIVIRAAGTVGVSQRDVDVVYTYVIFGRDHRTR